MMVIRKKWPLGLAPRLIGLVVLTALFTGGLVGVSLSQHSRGVLREQIMRNDLATADLAAKFAAAYIEAAETRLRQFAKRETFVLAVRRKDLAEAERHLSQILEINEIFDNVSVYDAKGIGWASGLQDTWQNRGGSVADREWFQHATTLKTPYFGIPVISRGTGNAIAVFGIPLFDEKGDVHAVVAGGIPLASLSDTIIGLNAVAAAQTSLLDSRQGGFIVAHRDPKRILAPVKEEDQAEIQALAGGHGTAEIRSVNGELDMAAFAPVPGLPWVILILVPGESVYAPLDNMTGNAVFLIMLSLLFTTLLGVLLVRAIIRPVKQLVRGIEEIGKGNLEYRIITTSRDEIGRLAAAFNTMTEDLRQVTASRDDLNKEIAEREHAEATLRIKNQVFEDSIASQSIADINGTITHVNHAFLSLWNYTSKEEAIGNSVDSFFADRADAVPVFEALAAHDAWEGEFQAKHTDGTTFISHGFATSLRDTRGELVGYQSTHLDVTKEREAEKEIRTLNTELEDRVTKRTAQLEAANKELEAFSYSVSHDLRAPLRHVSGYVNLLSEHYKTALEEKGRHYLDSIADSIHQMGLLIDNLLQFSRTGRTELRLAKQDMTEIVGHVVESLGHDNPDRTIEWIIGALPPVFCDSSMLTLVLVNLLGNAVKFTKTRDQARIEIGTEDGVNETVFFVRDNGVGFDMQYAQKLFGVFQRLHPTEEFEGTGIGLANVRRIITRHGGRTWAEAELDKGAMFYFSIPKQKEIN